MKIKIRNRNTSKVETRKKLFFLYKLSSQVEIEYNWQKYILSSWPLNVMDLITQNGTKNNAEGSSNTTLFTYSPAYFMYILKNILKSKPKHQCVSKYCKLLAMLCTAILTTLMCRVKTFFHHRDCCHELHSVFINLENPEYWLNYRFSSLVVTFSNQGCCCSGSPLGIIQST